MNPAKKLIAFILSVSMLVSLCPSFNVTFTAETTEEPIESTETPLEVQRDFESEYGSIVSKEYYPQTDIPSAVISSTEPVTVYDDVLNGTSYGVTSENLTGLQIWLEQCIVYENGNIIYRYSLVDNEHEFQNTALTYQFIPAEYITPASNLGTDDGFTDSEEVSIVEDTGIRLDFVVENENPKGVDIGYPTATITSTNLNIYANQTYGSLGVNVGDASGEIIELIESFTFSNGEVIYFFSYTGETNAALKEAAVNYQFISADDVVINDTTDEVTEHFESIVQSGLLKDFEKAYSIAQTSGILERFSDDQLSQIDSIRATLEQMAANTADWTETGASVTVYENGIKVYRNPVTRPDDYVLANAVVYENGDETVSLIEEITFSETAIIGKYTDKNNNSYFIIDTDEWSVFEGRVPYRYISESDVSIVTQWENINTKGDFVKDNIDLYSSPDATSDYISIADGLSRGVFEVSYEIIHTDYNGTQEKWYWIGTPNWKDSDGNDVGYSRYVKAEDVRLVNSKTDVSGVSVFGDIPEGANLSVSSISAENAGLDSSISIVGKNSLFYDVSLFDENGNEIQPGEGGITVTFPESAIINSGLAVGDSYCIYHVHDGVTDVTGPFVYDGGDISAKFSSLSAVGIISSDTGFDLTTIFGAFIEDSDVAYYAWANVSSENDTVTIYGAVGSDDTNYYELSGVNGTKVEIIKKAEYELATLYQISDLGDYKNYFINGQYLEFICTCNCGSCLGTADCTCCENCTCAGTPEDEEITTADQAITALLATTTSEDFKNIYVSLSLDVTDQFTFAQKIQLFHYRLSLLISEGIANPEDYEFPGAPVESFTNVAPFVGNNTSSVMSYIEMQDAMSSRMLTPMLLSNDIMPIDEVYNPITKYSGDNLILSKTAEPSTQTDGAYTITLEAYVKGEVIQTTNVTPVDITIVMDVSGSMRFCMLCGEEENHSNHTGYTRIYYTPDSTATNIYYRSNGNYYLATYCEKCKAWRRNSHYGSGNNHYNDINLYILSDASCTFTRRMDTLKTAVNQFIESTKNQNTEIFEITGDANKLHRIAFVTFSADSNTIQSLTAVDANNYQSMQTNINNLNANGSTRIDLGVQTAYNIVNAASTADSTRKQVVIVFTDGTPTDQTGFKVSVADSALINAKNIKDKGATIYTISVANGSNVNAGGALPGFPSIDNADTYSDYLESPSVNGPDYDVEEITDDQMFGLMNRFMHLLSSNNPKATDLYSGPAREDDTTTTSGIKYTSTGQQNTSTGKWSSYYLVPTNADDLTAIFTQISNETSGSSSVDMDTSTKVEDIVAPQFVLPAGTDKSKIKVYEVPCLTYNEDDDTGTWDEANKIQLDSDQVVVVGENGKVDVTGFDFAANFVSSDPRNPDNSNDPNPTFRGKKLRITFDVTPNPLFLGGNGVYTNSNAFISSGDETYQFARPTVDIKLKEIEPVWNNQHIYYSNNADIKAMFDGATINGKSITEVINGVNNAYVNVVLTVDGIGTYTIPAGHSFFTTDANGNTVYGGTWELSAGANLAPQLNVDTKYTFSWTITPINPPKGGTIDDIESAEGEKTAWVYVYKPVLKFKDDVAYLGEVVPDISNNQVGNVVWVNESQGYAEHGSNNIYKDVVENNSTTKTDTTFDMYGAEPQLELTYSIVADATNDNVIVTANDIPVNVTVKREDNGTVITDKVTFKHQDCDGSTPETMPVFSSTTVNNVTVNDYAEFVIHVNTVSLDVSKIVAGIETDEKFEVTIKLSGNYIPATLSYTMQQTVEGTTTYVSDTVDVNKDNNTATILIADGQTYQFVNLPIGTYIVEEATSAKYVTTIGETVTNSATFTLSSTTQSGSVTFTNTINLTSLTIYKEASGTTYNVKDSFIFNVYEGTGNTLYATVVLQAGEYAVIPDLIVGSVYRVEEVTDWSWRYSLTKTKTPENNTLVYDEKEGTANSLNLYSFKNTVVTPLYWLDNESKLENRWSASGITQYYN